MDHISALRNVEEALQAFESGEQSLEATQQQVRSVLQTYATEFETAERRPYRAHGEDPADGTVVVAADAAEAAERVRELTGASDEFEIEPL